MLFVLLLWRFRLAVASTEWVLLVLAAFMLAASLVYDLTPGSWLADSLEISLDAQVLMEDTLELIGIALFATYLVRTSATVVREATL